MNDSHIWYALKAFKILQSIILYGYYIREDIKHDKLYLWDPYLKIKVTGPSVHKRHLAYDKGISGTICKLKVWHMFNPSHAVYNIVIHLTMKMV